MTLCKLIGQIEAQSNIFNKFENFRANLV